MENIIHIRRNQTPIHSIDEFMAKKSSVSQGVKEVCFVRLVGTNASLASDIRRIDSEMILRMSKEPDFIYHRAVRPPVLSSPEDIAYYGARCEEWALSRKETASSKVFGENTVYNRLLGGALKQTAEFYAADRPSLSASMEKNLIVKMLFWHDSLLGCLPGRWEERLTIKLVLSDLVMEQEYLFACLLTLLGYDVLLLQSKADISEKQDARGLSQKLALGAFGNPGIPPFNREQAAGAAERYGSSGTPAAVKLPPRPGTPSPEAEHHTQPAGASCPVTVKIPPRPGAKTQTSAAAGTSARQTRPVTVKLPARPGRAAGQPDKTAVMPAQSAESGSRAMRLPPHPGRSGGKSGSAAPVSSRPGAGTAANAVSRQAAAGTAAPVSSRPTTGSASNAAGPPAEKSFEELALLAASVVMIAIHGANGDVIGTGSGIMVGRDGYILTNNHVASGGRYYSVRIEDDETVYTTDELIKYHSTLDLAILRIDRRLTPLPVYRGKAPLVRGQKVVAIGSPLGLFNSVSDGIISGFRNIDGVDMIQFTAPTSHGSSGGAVLNLYGEVIGISTAGIDAGQNINLAMGYECISRFISGFV